MRWERAGLNIHEGPIGRWVLRKVCKSPMEAVGRRLESWNHNIGVQTDWDGFRAAIAGTIYEEILEGAEVDRRTISLDGVHEIAMATQRKQIEYMVKMGWRGLARQCLEDEEEKGVLRWRGRTAAAVTGIPQADLKAARRAGVEITIPYIRSYRLLAEWGIRPTPAQIERIGRDIEGAKRAAAAAQEIFRDAGRVRKALKYVVKTGRPVECADYWRDSVLLGRDMREDRVAFPGDLEATHARDRQRVATLQTEELDGEIARRLPQLEERFNFCAGGMVLRPARTAAEIVAEGESLRHCVGGYVRRYASGETVICFLRPIGMLDKPWRTVELRPDGRMIQDRGYRNDLRGLGEELQEKLDAFWRKFDTWRDEMGKRRRAG